MNQMKNLNMKSMNAEMKNNRWLNSRFKMSKERIREPEDGSTDIIFEEQEENRWKKSKQPQWPRRQCQTLQHICNWVLRGGKEKWAEKILEKW